MSRAGVDPRVALRPTCGDDLDFVLALERHPDNSPWIGQWPRAQHEAALASKDREHWLITRAADGERIGFLLAFDLRASGHGVYVKRIALADKGRGLGSEALGWFAARAFGELDATHVWLSVYANNARAQRTYRGLGFAVETLTPERRAELGTAVDRFSDRSVVMMLRRPRAEP